MAGGLVVPPKVGDLVWAKVEGYRWWPSAVLDPRTNKGKDVNARDASGLSANKTVLVQFFGTKDYARLPMTKLLDFEEHREEKARSSKRSASFDHALSEANKAFAKAAKAAREAEATTPKGSAAGGAAESGRKRPRQASKGSAGDAGAPAGSSIATVPRDEEDEEAGSRKRPTRHSAKQAPAEPAQEAPAEELTPRSSRAKSAAAAAAAAAEAAAQPSYAGVYPAPRGKQGWEARAKDGRVQRSLGVFPTREEAATAYDIAAVQRYGARAETNFPLENYLPSPRGLERTRRSQASTGKGAAPEPSPRGAPSSHAVAPTASAAGSDGAPEAAKDEEYSAANENPVEAPAAASNATEEAEGAYQSASEGEATLRNERRPAQGAGKEAQREHTPIGEAVKEDGAAPALDTLPTPAESPADTSGSVLEAAFKGWHGSAAKNRFPLKHRIKLAFCEERQRTGRYEEASTGDSGREHQGRAVPAN